MTSRTTGERELLSFGDFRQAQGFIYLVVTTDCSYSLAPCPPSYCFFDAMQHLSATDWWGAHTRELTL